MNKLNRIKTYLDIYKMNASAVTETPEFSALEGQLLAKRIEFILEEVEELNEDVTKPTASEVKQMIDELRTEMNKKFDKVRSAAILHKQNYHSNGISGGTF